MFVRRRGVWPVCLEFKAMRKATLAITAKLAQSEKRQGRAKCSHRGSFKTWNTVIKLIKCSKV